MARESKPLSIIQLTPDDAHSARTLSAKCQSIHRSNEKLVSLIELDSEPIAQSLSVSDLWERLLVFYQKSRNRSAVTRFEDTLRSINQLLPRFEPDVLDQLNWTIALIDNGELYFSTLNKGHLLLLRQKKLTRIARRHNQLTNRFQTLTSGELRPSDWLIVGSDAFQKLIESADLLSNEGDSKEDWLRDQIEKLPLEERGGLAGLCFELSTEKALVTIKIPSPLATDRPKFSFRLPKLFARRPKQPKVIEPETPASEPESPPELGDEGSAAQPRRRRFPYLLVVGIIIFLGLLTAGIWTIRNEFKKVGQLPEVKTPTIADLIAKTPTEQLFPFLEQNLTLDNYQALSAAQKTTFGQKLVSNSLQLIDAPSKVAELPNPGAVMTPVANSLFIIDSTGQLWQYQTNLIKVAQASLITNPVSLVALTEKKLLVSDQAGAVWLVDGSPAAPINLVLPPELSQGQKLLQKSGSTVYLYANFNQTIYKIGGFISDIGTPTAYVNPDVLNFGKFVDWTLATNFIGLTDNGVLKDFSKAKLGGLSLNYYQDGNPIRLALAPGGDRLVVARGKFVTTYAYPGGGKQTEKVLLAADPITDVTFGSDGTLFVLAGKNLYKLP